MDWVGVIERNRQSLRAIVACLLALLGDAAVARIPRSLHASVLRVLTPAEAALRRLIVIAAARVVAVKPAIPHPKPKDPIKRASGGERPPAFRLFDPRKRFAFLDHEPTPPDTPGPWPADGPSVARQPGPVPKLPGDGLVAASRLRRRIEALKLALADVPRQAKRLVRARARRAKVPRLQLQSVMRPGRPPGYRKVPLHEVDHVLAECHWLAKDVEAYDASQKPESRNQNMARVEAEPHHELHLASGFWFLVSDASGITRASASAHRAHRHRPVT